MHDVAARRRRPLARRLREPRHGGTALELAEGWGYLQIVGADAAELGSKQDLRVQWGAELA